jgi:nucleoside-diphosphate-sugar epimerase
MATVDARVTASSPANLNTERMRSTDKMMENTAHPAATNTANSARQSSSEDSAEPRPTKRILIAGCGYVGRAIAERLTLRGQGNGLERWQVLALSRTAGALPAGAQPLCANLADRSELEGVISAEIHAVVFCAAPDSRTDSAYEQVYCGGLRNLVNALRGQPLQRFFFTSSTAVYAQDDGSWVDEHSTTTPLHFSGRRMLEAEQILSNSGFPATILRCAGIYGPGRDRLIRSVLQGEDLQETPRFTNRIHRDDIAGVVCHLLAEGTVHAENAPPCLILSDDDPAPSSAVRAFLAERLGRPLAGPPHDAVSAGKRCRNTLLHTLGYNLLYPTFREGYSAMVPVTT